MNRIMLLIEKTVAEFEAEASRIRIVAKKAKAEAESKRLQGQGIADQRRNCQRVSGKCRCTEQSWY
jgi:DNA invertase Pin-like site-specific DNA recombinase